MMMIPAMRKHTHLGFVVSCGIFVSQDSLSLSIIQFCSSLSWVFIVSFISFSGIRPFLPNFFTSAESLVARPGFSQVMVLLGPANSSVYRNWVVEWRGVGDADWQSRTLVSTARQAALGELADGSYEIRVRALGVDPRDDSAFTVPIRFVLPESKGNMVRARLFLLH